jgi:hypothetical protein
VRRSPIGELGVKRSIDPIEAIKSNGDATQVMVFVIVAA